MKEKETQYRNHPWKVTCMEFQYVEFYSLKRTRDAAMQLGCLLINTISAPNEVILPSSICWDNESTALVSSFLWSISESVESRFCPKATARIVSVVKDPYTLHDVNIVAAILTLPRWGTHRQLCYPLLSDVKALSSGNFCFKQCQQNIHTFLYQWYHLYDQEQAWATALGLLVTSY